MKYLLKNWILVMMAVIASMTLASCGDDDDEPNSALIGTWATSRVDDEEGPITSAVTFKKDGKCVISEAWALYPEDNYTVTFFYTVEGDLSKGATLKMWGKYADGDDYAAVFTALISGNTLTLHCISGDVAGDTVVFTKQ